jgi:hypothetical protein
MAVEAGVHLAEHRLIHAAPRLTTATVRTERNGGGWPQWPAGWNGLCVPGLMLVVGSAAPDIAPILTRTVGWFGRVRLAATIPCARPGSVQYGQ